MSDQPTEAHPPFDWSAFAASPTNERTAHLETEYRRMIALTKEAIHARETNTFHPTLGDSPEQIVAVVSALQKHIPKSPETLNVLLPFAAELDELADRAQNLASQDGPMS